MKMISDETSLKHYGILGMKWGIHRGPRLGVTKQRQDEFAKKDVARLDSGKHLSVGIGKKRQAAYDARDRRLIENRKQSPASIKTARLASALKASKKDIKNFSDNKNKIKLSDKDKKEIVDGLVKHHSKLQTKLIKSQYADEYMAGLSKAGKIYAKVTAGDKIYANTRYGLDKAFPMDE